MASTFIPVSALTAAQLTPEQQEFYALVIKNNTAKDGRVIDPRLLSRLQDPICLKCQAAYKEKYPGQPFRIKCDGVYSMPDFLEVQEKLAAQDVDEDIDGIQEDLDPAFWTERHIVVKDQNGDIDYIKLRDFQVESLRCTAGKQVDRWGRGTGKTTVGVAKELHKATKTKNYEVLVICPADSQSEKWWDEINFQLDNSPALQDLSGRVRKKQKPFKRFDFPNKCSIRIFTAGSASGRGANSIRSQSPRRIRIDEQDYLVDKDWEAIDALLNRYENSEFHGSSTPCGDRTKFWHQCKKFPHFRELHVPITRMPDWGEEKELLCRLEAKTEDRFRHEYLAEFSDPSQGVFKQMHVDNAMKRYDYKGLRYKPECRYSMGIDWNGEGHGTRIRVIEYDPVTRKRRCVEAVAVDKPGSTARDSMDRIVELNRYWHCEEGLVYLDFGFGALVDEQIRQIGAEAPPSDPETRKLKSIQVIDFGANLKTNRLVPKRKQGKYLPDEKEEMLQRRTKPFMVDGAVMAFENQMVEYSDADSVLDEQLRGYRVKNYSQHGYANTYETSAESGDHDLDAFMLALLAIEQKYGLYATRDSVKRLAQLAHVSGWGVGHAAPVVPQSPAAQVTEADEPVGRQLAKAGVPSRSRPQKSVTEYRVVQAFRGSAIVAPSRNPSAGRSRTAVFRNSSGSPGFPGRFSLR